MGLLLLGEDLIMTQLSLLGSQTEGPNKRKEKEIKKEREGVENVEDKLLLLGFRASLLQFKN